MDKNDKILSNSSDVLENNIREDMPEILDILLIDRTKSTVKKNKNIIWATDDYKYLGAAKFSAKKQILPECITGINGDLIKPRALKTKELQKERTKAKAEVFTPAWVVKMQVDSADKDVQTLSLSDYVKKTWLEITSGEGPYMAMRYDAVTGEKLPINKRFGFVDRKLQRINNEVSDKAEWQQMVIEAFKASYGFEWSGDSLLLARENLLYTYRDYYVNKWNEEPIYSLFHEIAQIISYNVFQMDGLKYIVPLSEKREKLKSVEISLFDEELPKEHWVIKPGKRVKIMNWETNKMEYFDKGMN